MNTSAILKPDGNSKQVCNSEFLFVFLIRTHIYFRSVYYTFIIAKWIIKGVIVEYFITQLKNTTSITQCIVNLIYLKTSVAIYITPNNPITAFHDLQLDFFFVIRIKKR